MYNLFYVCFLTVDVCQCPNSVSSSTVPTGANDTGSIVVVSVCSGKPCQDSNSSFTYQVIYILHMHLHI